MRRDSETEEVLLERIAPPEGYVFRRGLWCTHDLTMRTVTDLIVPSLLGVASRTADRRRQEAVDLTITAGAERPRLLILHSAGRFTPGPAFPDWVQPIAVAGRRRLHAKFAILQFDKMRGTGSWTTAFVTSANLTPGGVQDNRELLIWVPIPAIVISQSGAS